MPPDRDSIGDILAPFRAERDRLLLPVVRWITDVMRRLGGRG